GHGAVIGAAAARVQLCRTLRLCHRGVPRRISPAGGTPSGALGGLLARRPPARSRGMTAKDGAGRNPHLTPAEPPSPLMGGGWGGGDAAASTIGAGEAVASPPPKPSPIKGEGFAGAALVEVHGL